ncbi:hypothetical protein [Abyssalbus ytuae]|uniref:Uncharacterized protein n=1 Tax=Abyssalbus ytuae TaxID=2926907 RepID=A0A9E7A0F0_9FLAO|nr:hypothetical protein [Abyssalbus ytuae]UOB18577.1 hypothetical protein MQE35_04635 [Abyssalbus ytuae]
MKANKILWIGGVVVGSLALFGHKKFKAAETVLNNLQLKIKDIRNINLSFERIKLTVDAILVNPTDVDFGFTTSSKIYLKQIRVYNKQGQKIATGHTQFYEINLPAQSEATLPSIDIEAPLLESLMQLLQKDATKDLKIEADIQAFGRIFTIKQ